MGGQPHGLIFDDPGMGKSKMFVDFCCGLYAAGKIRTVFIVCPAYIRDEWDNLELGHIAQDAWDDQGHLLHRFDSQNTQFDRDQPELLWVISSYDCLRNSNTFSQAIIQLRRRGDYVLVLDETSWIANRNTSRTKTMRKFAEFAKWRYAMNGTPLGNRVTDVWSQTWVIAPEALGGQRWWQFRDRHAKLGGWKNKSELGVRNEKELWDSLRSNVLLRTAADHLNLDEPIRKIIPVPMPRETWLLYQEMREDMVTMLDDRTVSAVSAGIKGMRMAQLTSGFIGGIKGDCLNCGMPSDDHALESSSCVNFVPETMPPRLIDTVKIDALMEWVENKPCGAVWSRWRFEITQVAARFLAVKLRFGVLVGGMTMKDRERVKNDYKTGVIDWIIANPQAAGLGLNLQRAHNMAFLSNVGSWVQRDQAEKRMIRLGQTKSVGVTDFVATSPNGKLTIDSGALKRLAMRENLGMMAKEAWKTIV